TNVNRPQNAQADVAIGKDAALFTVFACDPVKSCRTLFSVWLFIVTVTIAWCAWKLDRFAVVIALDCWAWNWLAFWNADVFAWFSAVLFELAAVFASDWFAALVRAFRARVLVMADAFWNALVCARWFVSAVWLADATWLAVAVLACVAF